MVNLRASSLFFIVLGLTSTGASLAAEPRSGDGQVTKPSPTQSELDDAQRHYKRGVELFKNAVYDGALIEFRRAFELAPSYKILYNIGQVNRQLDDYAAAVDAYRRYLREGASNVPDARKAQVEAEIEKISQWVGTIQVSSSLPGAEISVDDLAIGRVPIHSALVNAGRRRITATVAGRSPLTRIVDVATGETVKLAFDFVEATAESPPPKSSRPSEPVPEPTKRTTVRTRPELAESSTSSQPSASSHGTPWLLWGGAVLLAGGAVGTGLFALRASRDIDDLKRQPAPSDEAYDDLHSRMRGFSIATDVLAGLAVATGAVATYFTLTSTSTQRQVGIGVAPTGLWVRSAF
jgi:hypothetical protein